MRVSELMTRDVSCCSADDPLTVPAQIMWEQDCGSVPVLDPQTGRAIGMITDRDICMATLLRDRAPSALRASDAMSRTLHYCSPGNSIVHAESVLRRHQIRRLPVLDDAGRPIGILSLADIVREAEIERNRGRKEVVLEEIADTLSVICQPRLSATMQQLGA